MSYQLSPELMRRVLDSLSLHNPSLEPVLMQEQEMLLGELDQLMLEQRDLPGNTFSYEERAYQLISSQLRRYEDSINGQGWIMLPNPLETPLGLIDCIDVYGDRVSFKTSTNHYLLDDEIDDCMLQVRLYGREANIRPQLDALQAEFCRQMLALPQSCYEYEGRDSCRIDLGGAAVVMERHNQAEEKIVAVEVVNNVGVGEIRFINEQGAKLPLKEFRSEYCCYQLLETAAWCMQEVSQIQENVGLSHG